MDEKEREELKELQKKDKAGTLTEEETERIDMLLDKFIREHLYMGAPPQD